MNITKLLVVLFVGAFCGNVGAMQPGRMTNDTKLTVTGKKMRISMTFEDTGNSTNNGLGSIIGAIIGTILGNKTGPINITIPNSPNIPSPGPFPGGGLVGVAPSPTPEGSNDTEAPISGDIVGVAPSPAPEGETTNETEAPISGGIVGVAPAPEGGVLVTTNDLDTELIIDANGSEDFSNDWSGARPLDEVSKELLDIKVIPLPGMPPLPFLPPLPLLTPPSPVPTPPLPVPSPPVPSPTPPTPEGEGASAIKGGKHIMTNTGIGGVMNGVGKVSKETKVSISVHNTATTNGLGAELSFVTTSTGAVGYGNGYAGAATSPPGPSAQAGGSGSGSTYGSVTAEGPRAYGESGSGATGNGNAQAGANRAGATGSGSGGGAASSYGIGQTDR
ncbi:hypothetical protein AALP_AA2G020200 [Arabis alpina]|uniref:Uncharacterized protein n=1 Tax=Arabis alpina TaxID=50452 RepID=A0A087HES1_ARAAL|nr:hypothetical protein AALP_AA2G020200 [Arabis alpina]